MRQSNDGTLVDSYDLSVVFRYAVGAGAMGYLGHEVITTSAQQVDEQAAGLLVDLDNIIAAILKTAS